MASLGHTARPWCQLSNTSANVTNINAFSIFSLHVRFSVQTSSKCKRAMSKDYHGLGDDDDDDDWYNEPMTTCST